MAETRSVRLPAEWDRLELEVRRLLRDSEDWRKRAEAAESRVRDLESTIDQLTGGELDPVALREQVAALDRENRTLRERVKAAEERVRAVLTRLDFLQEHQ